MKYPDFKVFQKSDSQGTLECHKNTTIVSVFTGFGSKFKGKHVIINPFFSYLSELGVQRVKSVYLFFEYLKTQTM